ncbi:CCHC-type domain-containing protein [Aphis craccivora]|uniref:CCHC-type domain-containing protein n=1 Tax=Aphis craccivora TaxID=307492 RepID=A0A6G0YFU2_APHCR|nr:CCHC-type domain-containing protein [Aphis craccivora]
MSDTQSRPEESSTAIKAPSYNELVQITYSLREQLRVITEASRESTPVQVAQPQSPTSLQMIWIVSVTGVADMNSWDCTQRLHFVRAHVSGAARSWFLSEQFVDWPEFENKFRDAFVQEIRLSDRWNELNQRNQGVDEHLVDYFYEKVRLCRVLKLPFNEIRDHVIQGLRSRELAIFAMGRSHTTESGFLSDLRDWERMRLLHRDRFPAKNALNSPTTKILRPKAAEVSTPTSSSPAKNSEVVKPKTYYKPIADRSSITCYNCRENREAYRADSIVAVPYVNPFSKTILLNRLPASGLIDSGCSNVLIRQSMVQKCCAELRPKPSPLFTVGDASQPGTMAIGEATLDVTVDGVVAYDHEVIVVPDHTIPVDVLVGRTWLVLPHVNYYKKGTELIFETRSDVPNYVAVESLEHNVPNCQTRMLLTTRREKSVNRYAPKTS